MINIISVLIPAVHAVMFFENQITFSAGASKSRFKLQTCNVKTKSSKSFKRTATSDLGISKNRHWTLAFKFKT